MSINLPAPIDLYFASENAHDTSAIGSVLRSQRHRARRGQDASQADRDQGLADRNGQKVPSLGRTACDVHERDGKVVVTGKVSGNFPGSPITLDHIFEIEGDKIVSLEIR